MDPSGELLASRLKCNMVWGKTQQKSVGKRSKNWQTPAKSCKTLQKSCKTLQKNAKRCKNLQKNCKTQQKPAKTLQNTAKSCQNIAKRVSGGPQMGSWWLPEGALLAGLGWAGLGWAGLGWAGWAGWAGCSLIPQTKLGGWVGGWWQLAAGRWSATGFLWLPENSKE